MKQWIVRVLLCWNGQLFFLWNSVDWIACLYKKLIFILIIRISVSSSTNENLISFRLDGNFKLYTTVTLMRWNLRNVERGDKLFEALLINSFISILLAHYKSDLMLFLALYKRRRISLLITTAYNQINFSFIFNRTTSHLGSDNPI